MVFSAGVVGCQCSENILAGEMFQLQNKSRTVAVAPDKAAHQQPNNISSQRSSAWSKTGASDIARKREDSGDRPANVSNISFIH